MITFPENPYDGQEVVDRQVDGTVVIWTYNAAKNEWTYEEYGHQEAIRIFTDQVMVRENSEPVSELSKPPSELKTQQDVNLWQTEQDKQIVQLSNRVADAVDFSQNTVGKGFWTHQLPPESELQPRPGEFWTNDNEINFQLITEFKFNDTGLPGANNPGSLVGTREGDYLLVQCNGTNDFGYYVVTGYETENIANQIIRTFTVKPFRDARTKGTTTEGIRHTVSTLRPVYTIVQDEQPVVSTRGVFWYREEDDHLLISNYADGYVGQGPQWTDLTGGGGDYLPLSGGTMKGDIAMGGHKITGIGDPKADSQAANKSYVDTRLMRTGGTQQKMEGILYLGGNKIAGLADPERSDDAATRSYVDNYGKGVYLELAEGGRIEGYVQFVEDTKLQMGGTYNNNIIDGTEGFTDNSIVATLGFVNHQIASIGDSLEGAQNTQNIRRYKFSSNRSPGALQPGEFVLVDKSGDNNVPKPENAFGIAFHAVNYDGKRSVPDGDAITFENFGLTFSVLNADLTKTYMRVGGYGGVPSFTQLNYVKDFDSYYITWPDNAASPKVSTFTQFSNGQIINIRIPDLFL